MDWKHHIGAVYLSAGSMLLMAIPTLLFAREIPARHTAIGCFIIIALAVSALHRHTPWQAKLLSAVLMVCVWFGLGLIESFSTGFFPPRELILFSTLILFACCLLMVFVGSAVMRIFLRGNS